MKEYKVIDVKSGINSSQQIEDQLNAQAEKGWRFSDLEFDESFSSYTIILEREK